MFEYVINISGPISGPCGMPHVIYNYWVMLCSPSDVINECASNPCLNGGTCTDDILGYMCTCPAHMSGPNCKTGKYKTDRYSVCRVSGVSL